MNKTVDGIIKHVDATMTLEGMPLTTEDMQRIHKCHSGESTVEEEIRKIKEKYK